MKMWKFKYLIFVFYVVITITVGTEDSDEQPVNVGGKIFCVKPAETYCLNVVNYPRKEIEILLKNQTPVDNSDLGI